MVTRGVFMLKCPKEPLSSTTSNSYPHRAKDNGRKQDILHRLSNYNNNHEKKTKKLSYGTVSAMCFVFILTENKRYIYFLKKKLNVTLKWFAE